MGKPFDSELKFLGSTVKWANELEYERLQNYLNKFDSPIYVVGSGGSHSACHFAVSLLNNQGKFARAVTPLELLYLGKTIRSSSIIFISASGRNYDIRLTLKKVLELEPKRILILTMKEENPLKERAEHFSIAESFDFKIPSGKDGFLATNSLVAFYVLLNNAIGNQIYDSECVFHEKNDEILTFLEHIKEGCAITVLHGGWSKSVAWDIESKCSEAGLTPTLISDYRNFGHGRHHWFSKRSNSAILALSNKSDESLCYKTLNTLPVEIPKLVLKSDFGGSTSAIDLLVQSFEFIQFLGEKLGIDPGRPGVPSYGRKLYHLPYSKLLATTKNFGVNKRAELGIKRKLRIKELSKLTKTQLEFWKKSYSNFVKQLSKARFGMVLLDYDGTLCSSEERYAGPSTHMGLKLLEIIENGFLVGVVTGRGKSVRTDLEKILPKKYWDRVLIGYYNGSDCGLLSDHLLPDKESSINVNLVPAVSLINEIKRFADMDISVRPNQLTIKIADISRWDFIRSYIIQTLKTNGVQDIQILESSHSMDIIPASGSKLDIIPLAKELLIKNGLSTDILCIGDKGQWPGNDFMLLNNSYGLSVDEVSPNPNACWNLASMSNRNTAVTLEYLNCLHFEDDGIHFKLSK